MSRLWTIAVAATLLLTGCTDTADPAPVGPTKPPGKVELDPKAEIWKVDIKTPIGLVNARGLVWVASADGDEIRGINPQTGVVGKSIDVGKTPLRLASQAHVVFVSLFGGGEVKMFDVESGSDIGGFPLSGGPEGVASNLDYLMVVRQDAGLVTQIQHGRAPSRHVPVPGTPRLVTLTGTHAFVTSYSAGTVTRIQLDGDEVVTSEKLCEGAQGVQTLGEVVWVTCTRADEVIAVDQKTLKIVGRVSVPGEPDGLTISAGRIFVVASKGPTLYQISDEPAAPKVLLTREIGKATALADRANVDVIVYGDRAWVSSYKDNAVYGVLLPRS
jgi:glutamine cyclotransferase